MLFADGMCRNARVLMAMGALKKNMLLECVHVHMYELTVKRVTLNLHKINNCFYHTLIALNVRLLLSELQAMGLIILHPI